jgi:hypothetical protein
MVRKLAVGLLLLLGLVGAAASLLHQVQVPTHSIQSSVIRSPTLLDRAWRLPVAATFNRHVAWQSNVSLCGPASLANIFRSLGETAVTEAKVLAGTGRCWTGFCFMGLTLDELADVARSHTKRTITVLRDLTPDAFHEVLRQANNLDRRYIVNFSREPIFVAGGGHHSPIGGYLESEDLVFVLDVSRDFEPWLIERNRLFAAVDTLDGEKRRGLLLIE